ncbi:hypothetical protein CL619_02210 [archaeon]|nr:hypothetical protein [archaeon]
MDMRFSKVLGSAALLAGVCSAANLGIEKLSEEGYFDNSQNQYVREIRERDKIHDTPLITVTPKNSLSSRILGVDRYELCQRFSQYASYHGGSSFSDKPNCTIETVGSPGPLEVPREAAAWIMDPWVESSLFLFLGLYGLKREEELGEVQLDKKYSGSE